MLIWLRRTLAILLLILSLMLFAGALLISDLNATAANPDFYTDQLRRADIYNFVYDKAIPAALDEVEADESLDLPIQATDFKIEAISAIRKILPPEWLQERVELAANVFVPYFRG